MASETSPRRIVIVAYDGVQPLDVVGPAEVFRTAGALRGGVYEIEVVASAMEAVRLPGATYGLMPSGTLAGCRGPIDTLVVAGGGGVLEAEKDEGLVDWIRDAAGRSRRITSVCSGAFLLAKAGQLDGLKATSHWSVCSELSRRYPEIEVDDSPIFVQDDNVWTSAGVTAGMDLALALVADDLGDEVAREVARWLVLFLRRPGGQAQFSAHISAPAASRSGLRELQLWIAGNLDSDLRVEALAERANMSPRNFARAFQKEVGLTPGTYVESLRVERARQRLELDAEPVEAIALGCGFGTPETMRRVFTRRLGASPAEYRARFSRPFSQPNLTHHKEKS